MKKLILIGCAMTCAVAVFAQGTVMFNNRVTGSVITHVYAPLAGNTTLSLIGNGSTDTPAGTTAWTGWSLVGVNMTGQYGAQTTMAQLLVLSGSGQPEANLVADGQITTFRSGAGAGWVAGITDTLNTIPLNSAATVEMVAWDNSSGLYGTWALANAAWQAGLIAAGKSGPINIAQTGGGLVTPPNLIGLQSFNLYMIPEPTTFALAGLGAAALLIFRRRK